MPIFPPIIAGESTLSFTRADALAVIGAKMSGGIDYDPTNWNTLQTYQGNDCLKSALNMFYGAYDWSFLRPWASIVLEVGVAAYDLPSDFGGMVGSIVYAGRWSGNDPVMQTDMNTVERSLGATHGGKGYPSEYATEVLPQTGESQGQRHALKFNRLPTAAAELRAQYYIHPYDLSSTRTYPMGGPDHAECLKWACRAAVEVSINEVANGPAMQQFATLLAASIRKERRNAPTHLGRMGNAKLLPTSAEKPLYNGQITHNGNPVN